MADRRERLTSVDALRGAAIVLMALDHVRDFLSAAHFDPTDLERTTPALFLTRWVTHFCAPIFAFLAGTSAYLWAARGRPPGALARFLFTRGLWLIVLELTVVRLAWSFNLDYRREVFLQVIWAIGWGMITLSLLAPWPRWAIAAFALVVIAGHDLYDPIRAADFGGPGAALGWRGWLWAVLHQQVPPVIYPLVPWIAVVPAGYVFAPLLLRPPAERRRILLGLGAALTAAFVVLRLANGYGDPRPWVAGRDTLATVMSFLDTSKYPPSLLYLLMTLGPAIAALPLLERVGGPVGRMLVTFGRVPLFFYVVHLYVIHALAVILAAAGGWDPRAFLTIWVFFPRDFGYGLPVIYAAWVGVIAALYPACAWFARVKARSGAWWMAYL